MKWFEGEIPAAIAESRQKNGIFVVVVFQKQDTVQPESVKMEGYWDKIDFESYDFPIVAIKVFDGTSTKNHFSQLYPVPVIPSAYFIDPSGRTLDIITLSNSPNQAAFSSRLDSVMKKMATSYGKSNKVIKQAVTSNGEGNVVGSNSSSAHISGVEVPSSSAIITKTNISDADVSNATVESAEVVSGSNVSSTTSLDLEAKVKRAKELLNQKHKEDEEWQRQETLKKEIERRNVGKAMAKAEVKRNEMRIQELAKERRLEKLENEKQLKRLREQIKADREERLRREGRYTASTPSQQPEMQCSIVHRNKSQADCRIQVKFPDGDTMQFEFQGTDVFSLLVDKIKTEKLRGQDFTLKQSYPRKTFEFSDYNSTFSELGLTPSATVLVFSVRNSGTTITKYTDFGLSQLFSYMILPVQTLLHYILSFIWPQQTASRVTDTHSASVNQEEKSKKEGNVHRFHNREDSSHESDDEPRWNGNSTELL